MSLNKYDRLLIPPLLVDSDQDLYLDEPIFNPDVHLNLTQPDFVVLLDGFQHVPKAPQLSKPLSKTGESQLAYSGPFQILSDEGYRIFQMILQREMLSYQISDARHPAKIRFSGYRSKWLQDLNRCPQILEHLSLLTGDIQLIPTTLQSNYSHINIGYSNTNHVDYFHRDSVPYVVILLASDMTNTIGGELQLIERNPQEAFQLIEQYQGQIPKEFIRTIDYLGPNSCVFMQGSEIVHGVTGIQSCQQPRITMVNSYMSSDPFAAESTRYDTFRQEKTGAFEFAMHKMWRANAQMLDLGSGKYPWPRLEQVIERLNQSIEELEQCRDLLNEKISDRVGFYDPEKKQMSFIDAPPISFKST